MINTCPYRKRETVFDLRTRDYYRIDTIKVVRMWGIPRTFVKLDGVPGSRPEDSWRELPEITKAGYSKSLVLEG